ncbi:MAG: tetratricopeptide repeat protein [Spirochaetia bacterium]|jgi:tetratricopeptide (TPR) repeat protein|nr:tetratricopeptide repeat protein [Spirochaetia bacterium]
MQIVFTFKRFIKLLFLLAACTFIAVSYYYSERFYHFYRNVYYKDIRHFTADDIDAKARALLKDGKKDECMRFLDDMLFVFFNDIDVLKTSGRLYMQMGEKEKGASVFIEAIGSSSASYDELNLIVPELLRDGYFGDIRALLAGKSLNSRMRGFYGIALYHTGHYNEAVLELGSAIHESAGSGALYYCLARSHERLGDTRQALGYMEKAYAANPKDKNIREALLNLYRKNRMFDKAAAM